jgi:hypothetical protein
MDDRTEYWWVRYNAAIQPAEVGFIGGIPMEFRFIGTAGSIPASSAELIERLPTPPVPAFAPRVEQAAPTKPQRSGSWLWFLGVLLLILVSQCSGQLFDYIK